MRGKITILFDSERGLSVAIEDELSMETIVEAQLDANQAMAALSRVAYTPCKIRVGNLSVVGKQHECRKFEFEIPKSDYSNEKEHAIAEVKICCPSGWEPDLYFGSQDSFFERDGRHYARTTIRRWVDAPEANND